MIDHLTLPIQDFEKSKKFYSTALRPLGYELIMEFENVTGFGVAGKPDFWISKQGVAPSLHIAFRAATRAAVDAFYEAAIAAGGRDNGRPGLRQHYHPDYYGGFVYDPDGHNIEAVCHTPEPVR
ncbi:MAG: VOC family protein [Candidatus Wallbacteria bacterium]|nr:VOC family protein [Candidatus Wallbacteria bacterium]